MKKAVNLLAFLFFLISSVSAQKATVEGYVFESGNRGYLNQVKITIYSMENAIKAETESNSEGKFMAELVPGQKYRVKAVKDIFEIKEVFIQANKLKSGETHFIKMEMQRKPGYLFDVTLAESIFQNDGSKNALKGALIEIFNNTKGKEELVIKDNTDPNFQFTFEQGNHYTIMVRKEGFFTKRMEAYVNIDGCILCLDGMGKVEPGVSDNLTEGNKMGSLLANVELDPIRLEESIRIENIYYDYNKDNIRPDAAIELDKIVAMMEDNPQLIIELGSHTDSRGRSAYNQDLSQRRAKSAVQYIVQKGVNKARIRAKGYGESKIANRCREGVSCSDKEHEFNRRTEIKVLGFTNGGKFDPLSLRQIILGESIDNFTWEDLEVIEVPEDATASPNNEEMEEPVIIETPARPFEPMNEEPAITPDVNENANNLTETTGAFGEIVDETAPSTTTTENVISNLSAKQIDANYSGYTIEFMQSVVELPPNHSIFKQYGKVKMDKATNGQFSYLIGEFGSEKKASDYMEKIITPRFPKAKVIQYEAGKRL